MRRDEFAVIRVLAVYQAGHQVDIAGLEQHLLVVMSHFIMLVVIANDSQQILHGRRRDQQMHIFLVGAKVLFGQSVAVGSGSVEPAFAGLQQYACQYRPGFIAGGRHDDLLQAFFECAALIFQCQLIGRLR